MGWFNLIGSKGKIIAQDDEGKLLLAYQKGESEINIFSKDNPLYPRSAADYEPRTAENKRHSFPHIWTPYSQPPFSQRDYRNIFDQSFTIFSTLDVDINITFSVLEVAGGAEVSIVLYEVALPVLPAPSGATPSLLTITPEKTTETTSKGIVVGLPELRQPLPAFALNIAPVSAPTAGEIKILNVRRY